MRRPLLAHLGYHHHGIGRSTVRPLAARINSAALRDHGCYRILYMLYLHGLHQKLGYLPASEHSHYDFSAPRHQESDTDEG